MGQNGGATRGIDRTAIRTGLVRSSMETLLRNETAALEDRQLLKLISNAFRNLSVERVLSELTHLRTEASGFELPHKTELFGPDIAQWLRRAVANPALQATGAT